MEDSNKISLSEYMKNLRLMIYILSGWVDLDEFNVYVVCPCVFTLCL